MTLTRRAASCASIMILEEILHAIFIDEEIRLRASCDADDVFVVVLDPTADFFAVDELDHDRGLVLRKLVNVFALPKSGFRRGLPAITAAAEFIRCSHCHAESIEEKGDSEQFRGSVGRSAKLLTVPFFPLSSSCED